MTIQQIVEESRKLGITYGEYVHRMKSDPRLIKPERAGAVKNKSCKVCGRSFFAGGQKYRSRACAFTAPAASGAQNRR